MTESPKLKVSFRLFVLNVLGAMLAGVGLIGVMGQGGVIHPSLAHRGFAALLLLVGVLAMAWFIIDLFQRIAAHRARHPMPSSDSQEH
jgi:hypothetical protein